MVGLPVSVAILDFQSCDFKMSLILHFIYQKYMLTTDIVISGKGKHQQKDYSGINRHPYLVPRRDPDRWGWCFPAAELPYVASPPGCWYRTPAGHGELLQGSRGLTASHSWPTGSQSVKKTLHITSHRWLSGELWYLQHNCVGDTIVYHLASDLRVMASQTTRALSQYKDCLSQVWGFPCWR